MRLAALLFQQQQQQNPPLPGVLESPVTMAALIAIVIAALAPHANKIAGAIIKVIESLAGIVEEWQRGMKAKNDIIVELRQQISEAFDQTNASIKRVSEAQTATTNAQNNANESLRLANEANRNWERLKIEKDDLDKRMKVLEKQLAEAELARKIAEGRANAMVVLNPQSTPAAKT